MNVLSENMQYELLFDALVQKYAHIQKVNSQKINSIFQFATTPIVAGWTTGTDAEAYELANAVPLNLDGYYVKGEALDRSYKSLIQSIKPKSGDENKRYRQITNILNNINSEMNAKITEARNAYDDWLANNINPSTGIPAKDFEVWLNDRFGGIAYLYAIEDYEKQRDIYMKEQEEILAAMGDPLKEAMDLLNPETMHSMSISKDGQAARKVPYVSISGNLAADQLEWSKRREGEYDLDVIISSRSTSKKKWVAVKETMHRQRSFRASVRKEIITPEVITDDEYTLKLKIVGLGSYSITRGDWFLPAFVNPCIELIEGSQFTNDTFFGKFGCLHLLPENLLVAYKISYEITLSTKCFQQEFSAYVDKKLDWFEALGFRTDLGSTGKIKSIIQGKKTKMIFDSFSTASPQIIGVTSKLVYNGQ